MILIVVDDTNSETIISHNNFKIWKLVKENFKTLCIWIYFYSVMLIYSSLIINKFFKVKHFLMTNLKKLFGATTNNTTKMKY